MLPSGEPKPIAVIHSGQTSDENFEYQWSGSHVEAHLLSDVGKKRAHNEDSCIICIPEDAALANERGFLFGVADGMGGASAGEFASAMALAIITDHYYSSQTREVPARLHDALEEANQRIFDEAERTPGRHGMGTTVSVVVILDEWAYIAQVGDSRVYAARRRGEVHQLTNDHSLVAEQVRYGYITPEEARTHALKNLITRAVGIKSEIKTDLFAFHLQQGDTLLICSDGLTNLVPDDFIGRALFMQNLDSAAHLLVGRALEEGGSDNITAVLIRIASSPARRSLDAGAHEVAIAPPGLFSRLVSAFRKKRSL